MKVLREGYTYQLDSFEQNYPDLAASHQIIQFIEKAPVEVEGFTKYETVRNGTTNEDVLDMLIHRMKFQNNKLGSREGSLAITKLEEARMWMRERIRDREDRGVLNTAQK